MATFTHLVMASFLLESESESVLVAHLCLTLCNPTDCSMLDSSVHGILQAKILEWVAVSFSRGSSRPRDRTWVSHVEAYPLLSVSPGKPWLEMRPNTRTGQSEEGILFSSVGNDSMLCQSGF